MLQLPDNHQNVTASADDLSFSIRIRIYYEDTDFGGVVYYANYLKYMERARTEYLRSLGFDQSDLFVRLRRQFVVRSAAVEYLSSAKFDDVLLVDAKVSNVRRASLEFSQSCTLIQRAVIPRAVVQSAGSKSVAVTEPISGAAGEVANARAGIDASSSGRLVATGKLLIACLDADSHKPRAIPEELKMSLHL